MFSRMSRKRAASFSEEDYAQRSNLVRKPSKDFNSDLKNALSRVSMSVPLIYLRREKP
jgi:hypothetical protein